ncbi:MAG: hypothetical protein JKY44_01125 [Flavobacteriaceae bacterium]|nr:hypothetical protein [Flavobacteriaceae bacterium]
MKRITILLICIASIVYSQKEKSELIGQVTLKDLKLTTYTKDSTASSIILKEHANYYFNEKKYYERITDYYFKKKIFKKNDSKNSEIEIPISGERELYDLKAYTYNLNEKNEIVKTEVRRSQFFETKVRDNFKKITFSFPEVQDGSVLEYVFSIKTRYRSISDWYFQSGIPKVKSNFTGQIYLGNRQYNATLKGLLTLKRSKSSLQKKCYSKNGRKSDCLIVQYGMDSIPSYIQEKYATSYLNYISRIVFDSNYNYGIDSKEYRSLQWSLINVSFQKSFSKLLKSKEKFFLRKIPQHIQNEKNKLERAKKIYYFIQKHFISNVDNPDKLNLNKTFKNRVGNNFTINLSLLASLNAMKINNSLLFVSTRDNGFPSKLNPSLNDFNYVIVKITINDKEYYLDASNKHLFFGITPFETLSGDARVMSLKKGGYWKKIVPYKNSFENVNLIVDIKNNDDISGEMKITSSGYKSTILKLIYDSLKKEKYIESIEEGENIEIDNFKINGLESTSTKTEQIYHFNYENTEQDLQDKMYINPFFYTGIKTNPFNLEERIYPVDFGFKQDYTYRAKIILPTGYSLNSIHKPILLSLPNKGGRVLFTIKNNTKHLIIFFKMKLNKTIFSTYEYEALKKFYAEIINIQSTIITLEKK